MGINLPWTPTSFPTTLDTGNFPTLTDLVHNILASHPNSVASSILAIETKLGINNSAVVGTIDYILKKGRHSSTQPGGGSASVAYEFDTASAHNGTDVLFMLKSATVERWRVGGGGGTDTYVEMGFGSTAAVSPSGKGRLRYNESSNRWEISSNAGSWFPIAIDASGGFIGLDDAYDAGGAGLGRTITADSGAVVINNAVGDTTNTLELTRTSGTGAALAVGPSNARIFGDGDAVFGNSTMVGTERIRVDGGSGILVQVATDVTQAINVASNAVVFGGGAAVFGGSTLFGAERLRVNGGTLAVVIDGTTTGTLGPDVRMRHNDGEAGGNLDAVAILSGWGANSTTPGTMLEYSRIQYHILSATAGAESGYISMLTRAAGTIDSRLDIQPTQIQANVSQLHFNIASTVFMSRFGSNSFIFRDTTPINVGVESRGYLARAGTSSSGAAATVLDNAFWAWKSATASSAGTQANGGQFRSTASTWTGAAEAERDWDWYAGVITTADESTATVSRMVLDLEGQNVFQILPTANAPGAATGVIFRNQRADASNAPQFTFRASAALTEDGTRVLCRWEDTDGAAATDKKMELLGNGRINLFSASPNNDSGFIIHDTIGPTQQWGVIGNNARVQFYTNYGFEFYSGLTPGSIPLARIRSISSTWGAGQPLFDITRDGGTSIIYQIDGDTLTTWTARTTASGVELQTYRDDGAAGAADEILAQWTGYGKDAGNAKQQFTAIRHHSKVVTAGSELGSYDFLVTRGDGTMGRMFSLEGDLDTSIAGETGFVIRTRLSSASFGFGYVMAEDSATVGPTFYIHRERVASGSSDGDQIGKISFTGATSAGAGTFATWSGIQGSIIDSDSTSRDGGIRFRMLGTNVQRTWGELFSPDGGACIENFLAAGESASQFEMRLTEDSATVGPILSLFRNRTTDAVDNDLIGGIAWDGMDDGTPSRKRYGRMNGFIRDSGAGSEDFSVEQHVMNDGILARVLEIRASGSLTDSAHQVWQVDDSAGPAFVDETADFNSATDADFLPFPATEAVGDWVAIGSTSKFGKLRFDNNGGTAGSAGVVVWEYWNGAWTALSGVSDGTSSFTTPTSNNQFVSWTMPTDWIASVINGSASLYYVRARVTTVYTTNPVYDQGFIVQSTDKGVVLKNYSIPGSFSAFEMRANGNYLAGQAVLAVTNNNTGNVPFQVDGDGDAVVQQDIEAVGGYKGVIGKFYHDNLVATTTDALTELEVPGAVWRQVVTAYSGSIVGIVIQLNATQTGGTLVATVRKNGGNVFSSATMSGGTILVTTQAKDTDTFSAGDVIDVVYTTSGFAPTTADAQFTVLVEQ